MGLQIFCKRGSSLSHPPFVNEESASGALTDSDIQFLKYLGYKVLRRYGRSPKKSIHGGKV